MQLYRQASGRPASKPRVTAHLPPIHMARSQLGPAITGKPHRLSSAAGHSSSPQASEPAAPPSLQDTCPSCLLPLLLPSFLPAAALLCTALHRHNGTGPSTRREQPCALRDCYRGSQSRYVLAPMALPAAALHTDPPPVGGIYSVLKSKAQVTTAEYGSAYTLLGPLNRNSVRPLSINKPTTAATTMAPKALLTETAGRCRGRGDRTQRPCPCCYHQVHGRTGHQDPVRTMADRWRSPSSPVRH
jgi:hypothetical protein